MSLEKPNTPSYSQVPNVIFFDDILQNSENNTINTIKTFLRDNNVSEKRIQAYNDIILDYSNIRTQNIHHKQEQLLQLLAIIKPIESNITTSTIVTRKNSPKYADNTKTEKTKEEKNEQKNE